MQIPLSHITTHLPGWLKRRLLASAGKDAGRLEPHLQQVGVTFLCSLCYFGKVKLSRAKPPCTSHAPATPPAGIHPTETCRGHQRQVSECVWWDAPNSRTLETSQCPRTQKGERSLCTPRDPAELRMNGNAPGHAECKRPDLNHRVCKGYTRATRT